MKCKHCGNPIKEDVFGWRHEDGWYACITKPCLDYRYAEPGDGQERDGMAEKNFDAPAGGEGEKQLCGHGELATGACENCGVPLCPDCDSGQYVDVMVCRDAGACEVRLRRKAVADRSRSLFHQEEVSL